MKAEEIAAIAAQAAQAAVAAMSQEEEAPQAPAPQANKAGKAEEASEETPAQQSTYGKVIATLPADVAAALGVRVARFGEGKKDSGTLAKGSATGATLGDIVALLGEDFPLSVTGAKRYSTAGNRVSLTGSRG
jgi:hypothetical protein